MQSGQPETLLPCSPPLRNWIQVTLETQTDTERKYTEPSTAPLSLSPVCCLRIMSAAASSSCGTPTCTHTPLDTGVFPVTAVFLCVCVSGGGGLPFVVVWLRVPEKSVFLAVVDVCVCVCVWMWLLRGMACGMYVFESAFQPVSIPQRSLLNACDWVSL